MMTALLILGIVALVANVIAIVMDLALNIVIARDLRDLLTLEKINTGRLALIERTTITTQALMASFISGQNLMGPPTDGLDGPGNVRETFETEDGRHRAPSIRELMEKINNDPKYKATNPDEIEKLRKLFEQQNRKNLPPTPKKPPLKDLREEDFPEMLDEEEDNEDAS